MPTNRPSLAAARRDVTGKAVARLRRDGRLPGVVYGHGVDSQSISLDDHEFELLRRHVGGNTLVDLAVDGGRARPVLIQNVQVDRVSRRPLHVDFFVVRMTEELTVDVQLSPQGVSPAVDSLGGILNHVIERVRVRALPSNLPQSLPYSIEGLVDFDSAIHIRDIPVPEGVTILADGDELVAKVERPRVEAPEPTAEAEAAPEGAEAQAAAQPAEGGGTEENAEG
jgi:large subunit ribosomal protein L25